MGIVDRLEIVKQEIPESVKLVAVSKTKSVETILEAYNAGQKVFGENRVQEMVEKQAVLPGDIEWHHIGHLQTNKVKYLAPFIDLIHAVDSIKLLREINKQAARFNRTIPCLMQIHIAEEDTKFGLSEEELFFILDDISHNNLDHVSIRGLMGMATLSSDEGLIRKEFRSLKSLFDRVESRYGKALPRFRELSMGMSGDYQIAIEEGSSMIRVGSLIFGSRH